MSERFRSPSMPRGISIGAARLAQARNYIIAHPLESKSQMVLGSGLSESTIARARRALVSEGLIPEPRNAQPRGPLPRRPEPEVHSATAEVKPASEAVAPPAEPKKSAKSGPGLLDHEALKALADMVDKAIDSGDDESIQKKLAKQALTFAFRTDLHPDTRMSASQMYYKLRDMGKAKDLGPGKPQTYEDGVARLTEMHIACGPQMVLDAVHRAFTVKEAPGGETPVDQAPLASGTAEAPGEAGHTSPPAEAEGVRPIDVGDREDARGDASPEHPNLPGPSEGRPSEAGDPRTPPHPNAASPWG